MERSIHVDKAEYAAELFGSFDVNAKRLEKAFGVTFSCRDSQIHVIGEEPGVSRAVRAAESLLRLVEKGETPENAEACADWLCRMGLINDAEYAGSVVRHYAAKGYGSARIKQELRHHGVPREMWDEAMLQMPEQDAYLERFIRSRLHEPGDRAQVKKVSDALFRRGYSWEQIKHALNEFDTQGDY